MGNENQTLHELIRARKQARPNKQNTDSGDTNSYENTAEYDNENLANSDTNTQNFANQNTANLNNQNPHLNLRDYDKDPLILRAYSTGMLHSFIFVFWIVSVIFIFNKADDYKKGYELDIVNTIVAFSLISAVILICISLRLFASASSNKAKYTYYYNSKVEYRDEKNQIWMTETFEKGYERCKYKMHSVSIIEIPPTRAILYLWVVIILFFLFNANFIGLLFLIPMTLMTAFLEILAYIPMYKKINGNLKNFWKYSRKLVLEFTFEREIRKNDDDVRIYLFDQKRHDEIRDYILKVFFYDIDDKNLINNFL